MVLQSVTIRPGHPDFLDLPWSTPLHEWSLTNTLDLPRGISRHPLLFVEYPPEIYVIKELAVEPARRDYSVLRILEESDAPAVRPVGLIEHRVDDPAEEHSGALITKYERFSFSYRELIASGGFGPRRNQMLDAFAGLLVRLHLAGCYWGDCSLSNVLYRYDGHAIQTLLVDAETSFVIEGDLTVGQRTEDLEIMVENVAGGMADIAAQSGLDLDQADLELGEDIARRYENLWFELSRHETIRSDERYRITERISNVNDLGFDVSEIDLIPATEDTSELRLELHLGGGNYHSQRLETLTGVRAGENQARQILADLHYFQAKTATAVTALGKEVGAIRWRVEEFEPMLAALRALDEVSDPIQAYTDLLHHRYLLATAQRRDVSTAEALTDWAVSGRPGQPL